MTLEERYNTSLDRVERIFEVPDLLKALFIKAMDDAINEVKLNTVRHKLGNQRKLLAKIQGDTLVRAKEKYISVLYEDTIIFTVSLAEQLLKDCFNELISNNLDKLDLDEELTVKLADLRANSFKTGKDYWAQRIIEEIHGIRSPQEKANFQNVLAVENLFKKYFKLELFGGDYQKVNLRAHYFFQVRHILLHNAGIMDARFVKNVQIAGSRVSEKDIGTRVDISRKKYEECKYIFGSVFHHIDDCIKKSGLKIGKQ